MARQDILGLVGLLVVLSVSLWLLRGTAALPWVSHRVPQFSPMDMPDWYRLPLEQGNRYVAVEPTSKHPQKKLTEKRAAVRGF